MNDHFTIKNWHHFQHYGDRTPPWIKLHWKMLTSEDWFSWNDESRVLAIACMLIASQNNGRIPNNPAYVQRLAYLNHKPNFKPLVECGFLLVPNADQNASNALASLSSAIAPSVSVSDSSSVSELHSEPRVCVREDKQPPWQSLRDEWNEIAKRNGIAKIGKDISEANWKRYQKRVAEGLVLSEIEPRIAASTFLRQGSDNSGWRFNLWWLLANGDNWRKVRDGNYDDKNNPPKPKAKTAFELIDDLERERLAKAKTAGEVAK